MIMVTTRGITIIGVTHIGTPITMATDIPIITMIIAATAIGDK